jgi:hypothetical protein
LIKPGEICRHRPAEVPWFELVILAPFRDIIRVVYRFISTSITQASVIALMKEMMTPGIIQ